MEIIYKNIDDLIPYALNQKEHPEKQINQIASSLKEFGFKQPIVIDKDNHIIVGHGRFEGAKKLRLSEVPVLVADDLTPAQIKAYRIADNKLNESEWNEELLKIELQSLQEMDFDYSDLGFDFEFDIEEIIDENEINLKDEEYKEKFSIIIDCDSELHQEEIFYNLTNQGLKCRVQSL